MDITDTNDQEFDWHGQHGWVVELLKDDAGEIIGGDRDSQLYSVHFNEHGQPLGLRRRNLRPAFDSCVFALD